MGLVEIAKLTPAQVASICDHTFLATTEQIKAEAKGTPNEGKHYPSLRHEKLVQFLRDTVNGPLTPYAVCVRPQDVGFTRDYFKENRSKIKIASVVGFPDGSGVPTSYKVAETELASEDGANEIDMVLDYDSFNRGDRKTVKEDISEVLRASGVPLKLILETCVLTPEGIDAASKIAASLRVHFIKTSTGYGSGGATVEALRIMRQNFRDGIKISGGVDSKNYKELLAAASGRTDGMINLDPMYVRIGESKLLGQLAVL